MVRAGCKPIVAASSRIRSSPAPLLVTGVVWVGSHDSHDEVEHALAVAGVLILFWLAIGVGETL